MANTICLSTDMSTLYLIDGSNTTVRSFSLSGNGVDVSLSGGDVIAQAAGRAPSGTPDPYSKANSQYTVYFDSSASTMEFIGVVDITTTRSKSFSLSSGIVNVSATGSDLIITA